MRSLLEQTRVETVSSLLKAAEFFVTDKTRKPFKGKNT